MFGDIADKHPFHLSEGYGRLVATVLQLSRDPAVLILDEPTIGLDWIFYDRMTQLIKGWIHENRTLILITHDMDLIRELGGRAYGLLDGCLTWIGETKDLLEDTEMQRTLALA